MTYHELENRTRLPQTKGRALGHPLSAHPSRKRWTIGLAQHFRENDGPSVWPAHSHGNAGHWLSPCIPDATG